MLLLCLRLAVFARHGFNQTNDGNTHLVAYAQSPKEGTSLWQPAPPGSNIFQGLLRPLSGELGHGFLKLFGLGELCFLPGGSFGVEETCDLGGR